MGCEKGWDKVTQTRHLALAQARGKTAAAHGLAPGGLETRYLPPDGAPGGVPHYPFGVEREVV